MPPETCLRSPASVRVGFAEVAGRSRVVTAAAQSPAALLFPRHAGDAAWACCGNLGGGLVDGDALALELRVGSGAKAALTTQASTKAYRGSSSQRVRGRVDGGAVFVHAPDPVVCYAGARYSQSQTYELDRSASLAVVDWLGSGRAARGERWRFEGYESRLRIERDGRLELLDATRLDPPAGLGRFDVLAAAAVTGPAFAAGGRRLIAELSALPLERRPAMLRSAAPFGEDGALLRLAAESMEEAARELRSRLSFVWEVLGDDPWSRRN